MMGVEAVEVAKRSRPTASKRQHVTRVETPCRPAMEDWRIVVQALERPLVLFLAAAVVRSSPSVMGLAGGRPGRAANLGVALRPSLESTGYYRR